MQLIRCGLIACLCAVILGAPAAASHDSERCRTAAEQTDPGLPLPYRPTASQEPVHLRVAGVRYAIPANYFRYPPIGCDTEENGFLLRVLLPTFQGWSKAKDRQLRGAPGEPDMTLSILLAVLPEPSIDRVFGIFARGATPSANHPLWEGLLTTKNSDGSDVFFTREGAHVTFLMTCKTLEQVPFPSCAQYIRYRGEILQLRFSRLNLKDWSAIRNGTLSLLDKFAQRATPAKATEEE